DYALAPQRINHHYAHNSADLPSFPTRRSSDLVPVALDVEIDRAQAPALIASARKAGIAVIASHHSFESTDSYESLLATFRAMDEAGADVAKVAMMPQNPAEVARLLAAADEADSSLSVPVLGISMGPA